MFLSNSPGTDRRQHRLMFRDAWLKRVNGEKLTQLDKQIADVVEEHPEYHHLVETLNENDPIEMLDLSAGQDTENPFLHMGLHLGLREQVGTDRPAGIRLITQALLKKFPGEGHRVEHMMMERLAESLWQAQRDGHAPDEETYLESLRRL